MTGQRVPGEPVKADRTATPPAPAAAAEPLLGDCDALLGEVGRRRHLFSWLRDPNAAEPSWLPVDAYYPRRRLVVVCDLDDSSAAIYRERVPAHGLALVEIATDSLGADPAARRSALERKLAEVPTPAPPVEDAPRALRRWREPRAQSDSGAPSDPAAQSEPRPHRDRQPFSTLTTLMQPAVAPPPPPRRLSGSQAAAVQRAARLLQARRALSPLVGNQRPRATAAPRPTPPRAAPARTRSPATGGRETVQVTAGGLERVLIGLVLAVILCVEAYLGVIRIALGASDVVLGLAILLDGCARAFGAIAALRLDREAWAWACVLGGSPVVAGFALFQRTGPVEAEPAPLAGLLSLLALGLAVVVLVAQVL